MAGVFQSNVFQNNVFQVGVPSGVGSASGTGSASGVGKALAPAVGAAAGTGTATGTGRAIKPAAGAAAGAGTAAATATGSGNTAGSASGVGAALAYSGGTFAAPGTGSGTGTATGVGGGIYASVGNTSGTGSATAVGVSTAAGTVNVTLDNVTLSSAGTISLSGSLSVTLDNVTLDAYENLGVAGFQRELTTAQRREVDKQESAELWVVFLTISHPDLATPIRVVNDPVDFVLDGYTYTGFLFDLNLLTDNDRPPEARLSIQNVDKEIGDAIRDLTNPPRIKIEVYPGSDFNLTVTPRTETSASPVYTADSLYLSDVDVDALTVSGRIISWDYTQEIWPTSRATKSRTPALFR